MQTGTTVGTDLVPDTTANTGTTVNVAPGSYYFYVGIGSKSPVNYRANVTIGGNVVTMTSWTTSEINGFRSTTAISFTENTTIVVNVLND